jgi:hypothetical protein
VRARRLVRTRGWRRRALAGPRRGRYGRRWPGPDEQDRARRVVDDEADVFTQALGTRAVAIARHDEHGGAADGGGDLVLAPSVQLQMAGVTAKPGLRPVEQFARGLLGPREQPLRRVSPHRGRAGR